MGGITGGQQATTSTNTSPPSWELPQLKYGANQAMTQYQSPSPSYYPGSTVANLSPTTNAGIQAATGVGLNGNAATNAGTGYIQNTLSPNFVNQQNANQAALNKSIFASVVPQVDAQFSAGGRYGSPDQSGTLGTAITNAIAPQMYQQYQQNQQLQNSAANLAPQYANTQLAQIGAMQQAGQTQDTQAQNLVNADVNHFNYNQQLPQNKLNQLLQQLSMLNAGTQSTSTQSQPGGGIGGFLGGVAGGLLNGVI